MTTTYPGAIDEMFAKVTSSWNSGTAAIVGYIPEIRWPGREEAETPPNEKYWARVSQQTVSDKQASITADVQNGKRRFTGEGLLYVQIFAPMTDPFGYKNGEALAVLARSAFRGSDTANVIFRNARINNLDPDGKAYRFNVVSEYEYDEIA